MKFHIELPIKDTDTKLKCCADWYGIGRWDLLIFNLQTAEAWRVDITQETVRDIQRNNHDAWDEDDPESFRWEMNRAFGSGRGARYQNRATGNPVYWGFEYEITNQNQTIKWIAHGQDQVTHEEYLVTLAMFRMEPTDFLSAVDSWTSDMIEELKSRALRPTFQAYEPHERPPRRMSNDSADVE